MSKKSTERSRSERAAALLAEQRRRERRRRTAIIAGVVGVVVVLLGVAVGAGAIVAALRLRRRAPGEHPDALVAAVPLLVLGAVGGELLGEVARRAGATEALVAVGAVAETVELAAGLAVLSAALVLRRRPPRTRRGTPPEESPQWGVRDGAGPAVLPTTAP